MREGLIVTAVSALLLAGGSYAAWQNSDVERAKRDLRDSLVDPESAKFFEVEKCYDGGQLAYVTGLVNARNSMGGMTGKRRFVVYPVGDSFANEVESGSPDRDPNLGDTFSKARIYASTHAMSCSKVLQSAQAEFSGTGAIDPSNPPLNATEGMDTLTDAQIKAMGGPLPDVEFDRKVLEVGNAGADSVPQFMSNDVFADDPTVQNMTPVDG